ncbi:hypothetical protein GGF43_002152, partial [Coemansia sp. RSA 2618]
TSIDVADADPVPSNSGLQDTESSVLSEPANMCIGALYTAQQACTVELGCQVRSVESLKVSMVCISCKQVVCNMGCGCVKKQHQISVSSRSTRPATTRVEAELLCLVSDGSGIAWAAVSNSADLACVLGLSSSELEGLYRKAAQSWNGQLLWRAPRRGWAQPQAQNSPGVVDRAAATAVGASILVEGAVQRGSRAVKRQQLRLDGDDVVVDKLLAPRIAALQVTRPLMGGGTIFQPNTKIRLTNVSIVRLRKGGKRFEVACYKNKVTEWRTGVEKDIDEVLQIHQVYMNVSKGEVAKTDMLQKCFKTEDVDKVIDEILMKGEQQVSDKERHHQLDNMFRDIATVVVEMCINPNTQQQYTVTMVEKAMSDIHYSVNTNRSAKQQALDVIKQLQEQGTIPIARAQMRIRIAMPAKDGKRLKKGITELISSMEDEEHGEEYEFICLIDPGKYGEVTELIGRETRGAGEVAILNFMDLKESDSIAM